MRFTDKQTGPEIALESVIPGGIIIMDFVPYNVKVSVCKGATMNPLWGYDAEESEC